MGFGGSVSAMIASIKNNSRAKRKTVFDRKYNYKKKQVNDKLLSKKATSKQLEEIRKKIAQQKKKERYKNLVVITLSLAIMIILTIYFSKKFNHF